MMSEKKSYFQIQKSKPIIFDRQKDNLFFYGGIYNT
jgi:hypothetical protein